MTTIFETIRWQEIDPGVFLCEDTGATRRWLGQFPDCLDGLQSREIHNRTQCLPLVVRERVGIDVFMIFRNLSAGKEYYSMIYVPAYVSRAFDLKTLQSRYATVNLEAVYYSLFQQLCLISYDTGHPCPIYASFTDEFMGFFYKNDEFLCDN